jgi:uncharacterized protein
LIPSGKALQYAGLLTLLLSEAGMSKPLMPKATAVWLVENTTLSFDQIAVFCGLHALEVQAIADGDVAVGIVGKNPIVQGILTQEDIDACQADDSKALTFVSNDIPDVQRRSKGPRYTAVTKRADKPDGIAYLLKHYPEIPDAQIVKLLGTTKSTIDNIRNRTHPNTTNIKPTDPVQLGLCSRADLDALIQKIEDAKARNEAKAARAAKKAAKEAAAAEVTEDSDAA